MSLRRALAWLPLAVAGPAAGWLMAWSATLAEKVVALSVASLAVELLIAAVAVALALFASGDPRERLGLVRPRIGPLESAVLVAGTLALSHALDASLALSGLYERSALADFAHSLHGARGIPLLAAVLGVGILPGLCEELLCRGVLQRSLLPRVGAAPAIGLAALAFGALHVEPIHAASAALLGAYLGVVGHRSGSVLTPVLCHTVNNLSAIGVSVRYGPTVSASPLDLMAGGVLAVAAFAWVERRARRGLQPTPGSVDG